MDIQLVKNSIPGIFLGLFTALFCAAQGTRPPDYSYEDIFNRKYQHKLISSGDNFPDFRLNKNRVDLLLVGLHAGLPLEDFRLKMKLTQGEMDSIVQALGSKGWLHEMKGSFRPTVFVATKEDGEALYKYAEPISRRIAALIRSELPKIKRGFERMTISENQSFDPWSFMILSNVLLDNWQINNVEDHFLGTAARPKRHGKEYYAAILEAHPEHESFGIYGNQFGEVCVYGNDRQEADLTSLQYFVSKKDSGIFEELADGFLPALLRLLNENEAYSRDIYVKSGYAQEITFAEFFIWWYHFIYTRATNIMEEMDLLSIPEGGNFVYELER